MVHCAVWVELSCLHTSLMYKPLYTNACNARERTNACSFGVSMACVSSCPHHRWVVVLACSLSNAHTVDVTGTRAIAPAPT